ncbi:MAG: 2'-5' RNA ligase family protein [Sarcina sp.]
MKRCIMIFPKFENIEIINEIREKYDPAAKFVAPHVTLVFPFESDIETEDLKKHVLASVKGIKPFKISIQGVASKESFGNYIFMKVLDGIPQLTKLHENLYTGILEDFLPSWLDNVKFLPHMTVGNLTSKKEVYEAIDELKDIQNCFETSVNEVAVEIIEADSTATIEFTAKLN